MTPRRTYYGGTESRKEEGTASICQESKFVKWGNGLALRIPKTVAERAHLREGNFVFIEIIDGRVDLQCGMRIPTLEELVAQITPENRHGETDWGPARGKEIVRW